MFKHIEDILVKTDGNLKEVLGALDKSAFGAVFLVDDQGVMRGMLTDGDIRRALLGGATTSDKAERYMNRNFVSGTVKHSREENLRRLTEKIRHLPILDEKGRPVDALSWGMLWRLPLVEPSLGGNELKYVSDCITSNWISSQGGYIKKFEKKFGEYINNTNALCTSSGTTALHLALIAIGIGKDDEVIVPDLTFAAPANVALHCGAKPVLVDVDKTTWNIDPSKIESKITSKTKAIIPVHLYGHPCDMDPILDIAKKHQLIVIEDCAEALGAKYKGRMVGSMGAIGCFSFFANKVITTGEGGMVVTSDPGLYEKMHTYRDHGMSKTKRYWHLFSGFNYRMTNIQAAIGLAQMERIGDFLKSRRLTVERYNQLLGKMDGIILPHQASWAENIYWLYTVLVEDHKTGIGRDELAKQLQQNGIETRNVFFPLHEQPPYQPFSAGEYPAAAWISNHGLSLPTGNDINVNDVDRVCATIKKVLKNVTVKL